MNISGEIFNIMNQFSSLIKCQLRKITNINIMNVKSFLFALVYRNFFDFE